MVLWSPDGKYYLTYSKEINVYSVEVSFATWYVQMLLPTYCRIVVYWRKRFEVFINSIIVYIV